jgi:hypothetical protein
MTALVSTLAQREMANANSTRKETSETDRTRAQWFAASLPIRLTNSNEKDVDLLISGDEVVS